jgi:hypothetical protein
VVCSVMINRLMFLYFIQAKSFLNGDQDYLRNKLKESRDRKKDGYYRDFLCPLFFEGFARKKEERSAAVNKLLGAIPYLNGGLFQRHQIEETAREEDPDRRHWLRARLRILHGVQLAPRRAREP